MERRNTRREFVRVGAGGGLLLLSGGGLLAACGGGDDAAPGPDGEIAGDIRFLKGPNWADDLKWQRDTAKAFTAEHANVKVTPNMYDWATVLATPDTLRPLADAMRERAAAEAEALRGIPLPFASGARVLAIGDSHTDDLGSWAQMLATLHDGPVLNAGVSGDTTVLARARVDRLPRADHAIAADPFLAAGDVSWRLADVAAKADIVREAGAVDVWPTFGPGDLAEDALHPSPSGQRVILECLLR